MVEHQPSKLDMWVRFPSPASFICASGSVGGAQPSQGWGRGFESRLALFLCLKISGRAITLFRIFLSYLSLLRIISNYSMIVATRPDPTVRPPSRIANVRPCSIAIGWMSSIVISTLSPGMHISVPSGRLITPVTSVVLK